MKARKYRRRRVSRRALEQALARIIELSPEQTERLERHRGYLEVYWNSPVTTAEAFVDLSLSTTSGLVRKGDSQREHLTWSSST